ncbi:MAG: hypothetical protein EXX96DRAFT_611895 [Benjaminiella poitrasii]|nr:MAG: hypothetical protein EXX96DRAFT_611895 [Benjaminiella poitrasii]
MSAATFMLDELCALTTATTTTTTPIVDDVELLNILGLQQPLAVLDWDDDMPEMEDDDKESIITHKEKKHNEEDDDDDGIFAEFEFIEVEPITTKATTPIITKTQKPLMFVSTEDEEIFLKNILKQQPCLEEDIVFF